MANRFDFEQEIMECWSVTSDIDTLFGYVCDTPTAEVSQDQIANILLGMKQLYNLKFQKMFATFEELVHERKI